MIRSAWDYRSAPPVPHDQLRFEPLRRRRRGSAATPGSASARSGSPRGWRSSSAAGSAPATPCPRRRRSAGRPRPGRRRRPAGRPRTRRTGTAPAGSPAAPDTSHWRRPLAVGWPCQTPRRIAACASRSPSATPARQATSVATGTRASGRRVQARRSRSSRRTNRPTPAEGCRPCPAGPPLAGRLPARADGGGHPTLTSDPCPMSCIRRAALSESCRVPVPWQSGQSPGAVADVAVRAVSRARRRVRVDPVSVARVTRPRPVALFRSSCRFTSLFSGMAVPQPAFRGLFMRCCGRIRPRRRPDDAGRWAVRRPRCAPSRTAASSALPAGPVAVVGARSVSARSPRAASQLDHRGGQGVAERGQLRAAQVEIQLRPPGAVTHQHHHPVVLRVQPHHAPGCRPARAR